MKVVEWLDRHQYVIAVGANLGVSAACLVGGQVEASVGWLLAAMWAYRTMKAREVAEAATMALSELTDAIAAAMEKERGAK